MKKVPIFYQPLLTKSAIATKLLGIKG